MSEEIRKFITVTMKKIKPETVIFDKNVRDWCKIPYAGHPNGCPNYGKKSTCPPKSKYMEKIKSKYKFFYLIYVTFDFKNYKEYRKDNFGDKEPTERQEKCLIYWQNSTNKALRDFVRPMLRSDRLLLSCGSGLFNSQSMESAGIFVFRTFQLNNIYYEKRPNDTVVISVLLCSKDEITRTIYKVKKLW